MALDKIRTELIADDAVTAAKIPAGAVGTTEIAEGALSVHALQNTTSHTLSGTYTDSKMYTSDAYVLGGDITVNSNLVLSTVKGDDSDITLTDDGTTRTITGTGKLEAGAILAKVNTDASTMTGALSSVVTGSPALNLSNATQFPAGHVLKNTHYNPNPIADAGYTSGTNTLMTTSFTPLSATNNLLIHFHWVWQWYGNSSGASAACQMAFYHGLTTLNNDTITWHDNNNYSNTFHRVQDMTQTFYIAENNGATTGAARTIYMTFTPTQQRTYLSDGYGNYYINIMEFA